MRRDINDIAGHELGTLCALIHSVRQWAKGHLYWEICMLRAEFDHKGDNLELKLEGRLVGAWAVQVKSLVSRHLIPAGLLVDISEVTYVDSVGEQLLIWLRNFHAEFVAETCYALEVCERLHLTPKRSPNRSTQPASEEGLS